MRERRPFERNNLLFIIFTLKTLLIDMNKINNFKFNKNVKRREKFEKLA